MEEQAPYGAPVPQGPRNLAPAIAAWLRKQDFTATEQQHPGSVWVRATWPGPQQELFELTYAWQGGPVPSATCWLTVRYPGPSLPETLITAQHVRRLKDLRLLLLGNVRYHNARLLARPAAPVPSAP